MVTWRGAIATIGAAAALFIAGCGIIKNYPTYRYRLTVAVDTPEGLRTGASVIEVKTVEVKSTLGGLGMELRGEAVAVDLGPRGTLFTLLRSEDSESWAKGVMLNVTPRPKIDPENLKADRFPIWFERMLANKGLIVLPRTFPKSVTADKSPSGYPIFVRFRDINDPKTVVKVDPDDLAASFGPGVKLRRMAVQLTDDPITTGLEKQLPSYGPETGFDNWYRSLPYGDPSQISKSEFIQGM